ncbi:diguanylate cyclase [bacterium]|nr:diguanylate cyclase [bacterium]
MHRFKDSVLDELPLWLTGAGIAAGLVLPLLIWMTGVPAAQALNWSTFVVTLAVGAGVGTFGRFLTRRLVRPELHEAVTRMRDVCEGLREASFINDWSMCTPEACAVETGADDEIGQMAETFNELVEQLVHTHKLEEASTRQTEALSSKLDLKELSSVAVDLLLKQTDASSGCLIACIDGELKTLANFGINDTDAILGNERVHRALETGQMQTVRVPESISIDAVVGDFKPRQVVIQPITYEAEPLGVVVLASDTMFGKDAMWVLDLFTKGMGLALNNAVTHTKLQKIAALDPLTGVYNRRLGMKRLRDEFQRAERENARLGVAMFDIDHFKRVNDTYGHLVGDRVLVNVADTARSVLRESDVMLRYGGEEFLVVLPGTSPADAKTVGERLRSAVEACTIVDGDETISVTVSVGLSDYHPDHIKLEEDLVKKADDALYTAKESGRNKVVCSQNKPGPQPVAPPVDARPATCAMP